MYNIFRFLFFPLNVICYALVFFYKKVISPVIRPNCPKIPTCSIYALWVLIRFDIFNALFLIARRVFSCDGKVDCVDYPPINIKGEYRWFC